MFKCIFVYGWTWILQATYSFRWLKEAGVSLGAENKHRVLSNCLVGDNLEVELTPFSFAVSGGGEEIRGAPHAFTPSLTQKVHQLLEENEQ